MDGRVELPAPRRAGRGHVVAAVALPAGDGIEAIADAFGIRWGMTLAYLQAGAFDEAERHLARALAGTAVDEDVTASYQACGYAVRGELLLARGETGAGLAAWRHAVEAATSAGFADESVEPGLVPWVLELKAAVVVAHARHGQLGRVHDVLDEVGDVLTGLLADLGGPEPLYLAGMPLCGALLLALAWATLAGGPPGASSPGGDVFADDVFADDASADDASGGEVLGGAPPAGSAGARMVALAERFGYLRGFQPTMSAEAARTAARAADPVAYDLRSPAAEMAGSLRCDGMRRCCGRDGLARFHIGFRHPDPPMTSRIGETCGFGRCQ